MGYFEDERVYHLSDHSRTSREHILCHKCEKLKRDCTLRILSVKYSGLIFIQVQLSFYVSGQGQLKFLRAESNGRINYLNS